MTSTPSKYARVLRPALATGDPVTVDVYDVLAAFGVTCPARAHALKKILAAGQRGSKSELQDIQEAVQSLQRAIELLPLTEEERALAEIEKALAGPGMVGRPEPGQEAYDPCYEDESVAGDLRQYVNFGRTTESEVAARAKARICRLLRALGFPKTATTFEALPRVLEIS